MKHDIRLRGYLIGYKQFLYQSQQNIFQSGHCVRVDERARIFQLWQQVSTPFDGAGEEFHEEKHIDQEIYPVFFGTLLLPVHICQITDGLECVE